MDKRMIDFVEKEVKPSLDAEEQSRLFTDHENFTNIDEYQIDIIFPDVFQKSKFDCIFADFGYNTYNSY